MDDLDMLMEDYLLPAQVVPLEAWSTEDLVEFHRLIDAELQRRHTEAA